MKTFFISLVWLLSLGMSWSALTARAQNSPQINPADCRQSMESFLSDPNDRTLARITAGRNSRCWHVVGSSNPNLQRLIRLVTEGDEFAASYLAANLSNLGGGNLEDSLIALGLYGDHNMEGMLELARTGRVSRHQFVDSLTMLPLSLSDDPHSLLQALRTRRDRVTSVSRADLLDQKAWAIKAMDDNILQIETVTPPDAGRSKP